METERPDDRPGHSGAARVPQPVGEPGRRGWEAVLGAPQETLLCLDFDGVLSPIVAEPDQAYAEPRSIAAIRRLSAQLKAVTVVTGRPVQSALRLGGFAGDPGFGRLVIAGQYGNEVFDAETGRTTEEPVPAGIAPAEQDVRALLEQLQIPAAIEEKGRAFGIHTRRLPDPKAALESLRAPVAAIAERHGLHVQPGRNVLEVGDMGLDKGHAVRALVERFRPRQVVYIGDDLGDLPAFAMINTLREEGVPGLAIYSESDEENALGPQSDLTLAGTEGVADWLTALADRLDAS